MSLWEYKQLYKQIKQEVGTVNEALIYQAWEDMQNLVESGQKNTKTMRRQEQRRKTHAKSQQIHKPLKDEFEKSNTSNVSELINYDDGFDFFEDIE